MNAEYFQSSDTFRLFNEPLVPFSKVFLQKEVAGEISMAVVHFYSISRDFGIFFIIFAEFSNFQIKVLQQSFLSNYLIKAQS